MLTCSKPSLEEKKMVIEKMEKQEMEIAQIAFAIGMEKLDTIR